MKTDRLKRLIAESELLHGGPVEVSVYEVAGPLSVKDAAVSTARIRDGHGEQTKFQPTLILFP